MPSRRAVYCGGMSSALSNVLPQALEFTMMLQTPTKTVSRSVKPMEMNRIFRLINSSLFVLWCKDNHAKTIVGCRFNAYVRKAGQSVRNTFSRLRNVLSAFLNILVFPQVFFH